MLENQKNVKSRSDKGYHAVPPPYTENYIPLKPELMFIDEQVKSEYVDVVSNVASSDVKTVVSKHGSVDVKNTSVYNTVETKTIRKNSFSQSLRIGILMMKIRVLDLEKIKIAQAKEIANLKKRFKKLKRKRRSRTLGMNLFKIDEEVWVGRMHPNTEGI
nr:hypothetical protein [Tanacetum cinerariifolium]